MPSQSLTGWNANYMIIGTVSTGLMRRSLTNWWTKSRLRQAGCGLKPSGHDEVLIIEEFALLTRCVSCGWESAGIPIESGWRLNYVNPDGVRRWVVGVAWPVHPYAL